VGNAARLHFGTRKMLTFASDLEWMCANSQQTSSDKAAHIVQDANPHGCRPL
jgi:hypothetical protein